MSDDNDLDRLERLNRLREAGALTPEEYDTKKREILSAGSEAQRKLPRWLSWSFGIAALAVVVVAIVLWSRSSDPASVPREDASVVAAAPSTPLELQSEASNEASPPSAAELLAFATSENVIGMSPEFLEQRLGTPKDKRPGALVYDIGGCTINYWSEDAQVTSLFFDVTKSCRVKIRGRTIGPNTLFGEILRQGDGGAITATCLADCGNAADPTIDLRYVASRATNDVGINFSSDNVQSGDALELWEQEVRREQGLGEFDPTYDSEGFNCATRPSGNVRQLATRLTVRKVWIVKGDFSGC